jgi:hypothetical protein
MTRELECVVADLKQQARDAEKERDALRAELDALKGQEPFDADDHNRFREAFERALQDGNWPNTRKGHGYRSPRTQMAWGLAFSAVNHLRLYARPIPASVPEGWQMVPIEPTQEMLKAMEEQWMRGASIDMARREYKAMLAAAPEVK